VQDCRGLAELRRAADLAPNSDDVFRRLGRAYLLGGQANEALLAYARAVEINPFYWVNHNAIGAAYLQVGSYDEAAAAFRRVIELDRRT
jgi:tetratricopeptide (TPR) repeat protein